MTDKCELAALMQPRQVTKMVTDSYNVRTLSLHEITKALIHKSCTLLHTHTAYSLYIIVIEYTLLTVSSLYVLIKDPAPPQALYISLFLIRDME